MERGGSNAGAGCGAAEEERGMARNYSRKREDCVLRQSRECICIFELSPKIKFEITF
jgi:hypothetical protein